MSSNTAGNSSTCFDVPNKSSKSKDSAVPFGAVGPSLNSDAKSVVDLDAGLVPSLNNEAKSADVSGSSNNDFANCS